MKSKVKHKNRAEENELVVILEFVNVKKCLTTI